MCVPLLLSLSFSLSFSLSLFLSLIPSLLHYTTTTPPLQAAVDHAKEGVEELVKAEEHQKNATPVRCIAFLVLGIVIMLAILIHRWKN